jgi:DNA-binding NtrC family response regulator
VDDESGIRDFLAAFLQGHRFLVLTASSGEEALRLFETRQQPIDLVVTDIVMSGINGKTLADRLRAKEPGLKVIFMSGYLPEEIAVEALDGVFFKKPFQPQDLLNAVRDAFRQS